MTENDARQALLVRAIERQPATPLWTDEDRQHASRKALRRVGPQATPADFIATRARLATERLVRRQPALADALAALHWRAWIGPVLMLAALLAGLALDAAGAGQQINILNPPLLLILAWNLLTYLVLAFNAFWPGKGRIQGTGLSRLLVRLATGQRWRERAGSLLPAARKPSASASGATQATAASHAVPPGGTATAGKRKSAGTPHDEARTKDTGHPDPDSVLGEALDSFRASWFQAAAPLYGQRALSLLHACAMLFALGALGGLYLRGLALEYRAGWESTFLGAEQVHTLISWLWGPASLVSSIPLPDAAHLASIRFPGPGENAAPWIHLQTLTMLMVVVLPRLLLAGWHHWQARRLGSDFPLALDDAHFRDLQRHQRGEAAVAWVQPYSYTPSPETRAGLESLLRQGLGSQTSLRMLTPLALGDEDDLDAPLPGLDGTTAAIALFSLSATPEAENHAVFLDRLSRVLPAGLPLLPIVDESSFRARFGQDTSRLDSRRGTWRRILATHSDLAPVFVDLSAPADAPTQLEAIETLEGLLASTRQEPRKLH